MGPGEGKRGNISEPIENSMQLQRELKSLSSEIDKLEKKLASSFVDTLYQDDGKTID